MATSSSAWLLSSKRSPWPGHMTGKSKASQYCPPPHSRGRFLKARGEGPLRVRGSGDWTKQPASSSTSCLIPGPGSLLEPSPQHGRLGALLGPSSGWPQPALPLCLCCLLQHQLTCPHGQPGSMTALCTLHFTRDQRLPHRTAPLPTS